MPMHQGLLGRHHEGMFLMAVWQESELMGAWAARTMNAEWVSIRILRVQSIGILQAMHQTSQPSPLLYAWVVTQVL